MLHDLVTRMSEHRPEPFIAPIPEADEVELFSHQQGIPYRFIIRNIESGWYLFEPDSMQVIRPANIVEQKVYLEQLPAFRAIILFGVGSGALVVPQNPADAAQRGWPNAEPRVAHISASRSIGAMSFMTAVVRQVPGYMIFDTISPAQGEIHLISKLRNAINYNQDPGKLKAGYQAAWHIVQARLREEEEARKRERRQALRKEGEEVVRGQVSLMGARLTQLNETRYGFRVSYEYDGHEWSVDVDRLGRVQSAGYCLSGGDKNYDLASLITVNEQARKEHRYDIPRERWI